LCGRDRTGVLKDSDGRLTGRSSAQHAALVPVIAQRRHCDRLAGRLPGVVRRERVGRFDPRCCFCVVPGLVGGVRPRLAALVRAAPLPLPRGGTAASSGRPLAALASIVEKDSAHEARSG
jgi:hypothetical protein